ncbi:MAG: hypothetical protein OXG25_01695 [Gammaproteobacteria bacterium]|nr:hypothetical protein [Gammaproteobacteria bacterium]
MLPLGFFSVCLRSTQLERTVDFYKALDFTPTGEDAPGLRVSLEYRSQSLTFMSFLQDNLINFRGAHIYRLKECMDEIGIPVTLFEEFKSEERLMLDDEGNPLPDNECGSFSIEDPDGHEFFFNTHREEREPFEEAVLRPSPAMVGTPFNELNLPNVLYTLVVTDLIESQRFYESLGLIVVRDGDGAWVFPNTDVGDTRFLFRLRKGASKHVAITLVQSAIDPKVLRTLGLEPGNQAGLSWNGHDPDGRMLEIRSLSF